MLDVGEAKKSREGEWRRTTLSWPGRGKDRIERHDIVVVDAVVSGTFLVKRSR